jgi:lysyl-tRNA synthetase, class II
MSSPDTAPKRFPDRVEIAAVREECDPIDVGQAAETTRRIAGRAMARRDMGKLVFLDIVDRTGRIQVICDTATTGEIDVLLGDVVGVTGHPGRARRGEPSLLADTVDVLARNTQPLPDTFHGLTDVELRYRKRYLDLLVNEETRADFILRSRIVTAVRAYLDGEGFVEVETPVLQPRYGGAFARPFVTHHNELERDLYLRIATELYLKRLIVGGLDKVFEMGRVFRNEGLSTRHNTEFTMLELYEAFVDYTDIMVLTERLMSEAALAALGTTTVEWEGNKLELAPPWERRTLLDLVREHAGLDLHPSQPVEDLRRHCDDLEIPYEPMWQSGKLILEIYEKTTESKIIGPTFVCDYPREVSPFAREHRSDRDLTERFELIVGGREIANAFSELNDPVDQLRRFEAQAQLKAAGDPEAQSIDYDYVRALEYGLPPCGGLGIGIDRLVMLLAGTTSIREVILFPQLRPEVSQP